MPTRTEVLDWLCRVPLFEGLSKAELARVAGHLREDHFSADDDIVTAETADARFYIVTAGRAKVIVNDRAVRTIGPGGYFGEMSLLDGSPRSATVRAETQVATLWLGRLAFLGLLQDSWKMTEKILADLCARIRQYDRSQHV